MFRPLTRSHRRPHRRGTSFILIVVVMLSITAASAVAFALFAMNTFKISGLKADAEGRGGNVTPKAPDSTEAVNRFFSALIYDVGDDSLDDLNNALRGHSFAASMYGRTPGNTTPWNGVGTFHEPGSGYRFGGAAPYGLTLDRAQMVNHTPMTFGGTPFMIDPEWMGHRAQGGAWPANFAASQVGRALVSKAAGYSYPDLKDFFLAQFDPATGQVLVPSFHRQAAFGSLDPNNANWYNAAQVAGGRDEGRLLTLRPRPAEHPQFPRIPLNADGTYTGDVQNLPGGVGQQRNDSLWMNLGLPITYIGKKRVQPLVAPLIIPLNALFDASSHGNTFGGSPLWAHRSQAGYGPWEVNPAHGLSLNETDRQNIIGVSNGATPPAWNGRGPRQSRSGFVSRPSAPYSAGTLPSYSPVAWNGAAAGFPAYPLTNNTSGIPGFAAAGFQDLNDSVIDHPALYNPSDWPASNMLANRVYPVGDSKRFNLRYAFTPHWYKESDLGPIAPTTLQGTAAFSFAIKETTRHGYRLDPAHANRALVTTRSFDLDRPKVVPNFVNGGGVGTVRGLEYGTGPGGSDKTGVVAPGLGASINTYPAPQALGPITDFAQPNAAGSPQWYNAMARLGSVNVNRPLADYRNDSTAPLSAGNLGNEPLATQDRKQLAHDIFVRFAVALGANAIVNPNTGTYTIAELPGTAQYNALRYLAQLAVNIVDYIDNDDVSTVFVWNPDPAQPNGADFTSAGDIGSRVVFGVEKPRLVINETYSEVVNDSTTAQNGNANGNGGNDPPAANATAHVKFWFELLNPTTTNNTGLVNGSVGPLGTGSVPLSAFRIEIRRAHRLTGVGVANQDAANTTQSNHLYTNPANVTGNFELTAGAADAVYTFPAAPAANTPGTVDPNNGAYRPAPNLLPANGFVLVGPPAANRQDNFSPPPGGVWKDKVGDAAGEPTAAPGSTALGYSIPLPGNNIVNGTEFKRHIVLLRRLANPYLPFGNSNPYITVDMMDFVPTFDAINRLNGGGLNRNPHGMMNGNGYDPSNARFSIGKVQPYAGFCLPTNFGGGAVNHNTYTFPNSMVLRQTQANGQDPLHTFGQQNGATNGATDSGTYVPGATPTLTNVAGNGMTRAETLMTPFDWLVHMDRPLVNQLELFQVRDTPAHRVTGQFLRANVDPLPNGVVTGVTYDAGYANWRSLQAGVARALEYLTVKPHAMGVAHGGRIPGRINVNGVQDRRIMQGLFDAQGTNNGFGPAYVDNIAWGQWLHSRTPVETTTLADGVTPVYRARAVSGTSIEGFGGDQPFMPFSGPAAAGNAGAFAYINGGNIDQTILRRPPPPLAMPAPVIVGPHPYLYTDATNTLAAYPSSHPNGPDYHRSEPARKIINNITYANQQYAVFLTIGYFEVLATDVPTANGQFIPRLGAEAYITVPGDSRHRYFAVVDMSNMALEATSNNPATVAPFFTSLEQTVRPTGMAGAGTLTIAFSRHDGTGLYVGADDAGNPIQVGNTLVIGYGVEEQVVTVAGFGAPGTGQVQVTGMSRTAWGGSCVSNVRPGYPGPQPQFRPTDATSKAVVPYFDKVK